MAISAVSGVLIAYSAIKYIAIKNTWIKRFPPLHVSILSMALAGMAFGVTGWRASVYSAQALPAELEGKDIQVIGIVAAMPQQSEVGLRFRFAVEQAEIETAVKLPKLIELSWYSGAYRTEANTSVATSAATTMPVPQFELQGKPQTIKPGERWQMTVRLKAIHGNSNPHGFDYELYQWEQGVQATGYVRATANDVPPKKIGDTWKYSIERLRAKVRDAVFERLSFSNSAGATSNNAGVTSNNAGVVAALVTGDQRAIDRADWDIFRATGVAHLMSISGLHITLFAWVAAGVVAWLWRRKSWSSTLCLYFPAPSAGLVGGVLLATAYAAFSGWGVPAQRTILMLATVSLLKLSGHRWPWYVVWTMACAIVVVVDPWALLQAGFWLSFVAVAVLFATDKQKLATDSQKAVQVESVETFHQAIQHSLQRAQGERHWVFKKLQTLAEKSGALLREQWVITLALTPLTMMLFGQVSVVGLLANLLAIPWVTLVVTPLSLLGAFFAPVWDVAAWSMQVLSVVLTSLSKLPFATFSVAAAPFYLSVLGILGGLLLVLPMAQNRKWQWKLGALGLSLLLPVLLWQAPRPESGQFELLAADIGQGNAVVIRTQNHSLLYDAGPRYSVESDAGHRVLVPLLRAMGERLDMVMLSHRDS
ncbi:MAG: DNA internalization-related competence protein ComEC/Rec2, partial [Polaromonas sp.]|nr:DNA internalization-related competence protein ComEC/Rec2 [Polaromonas sp.]